MPSINFHKKIGGKIISGEKTCTIRPGRRYCAGKMLYLFTGLKTRSCVRLMERVCREVRDIFICPDGGVAVDGRPLGADEISSLAANDGFVGSEEFLEFFRQTYGLPMRGQIIKW